MIPILTMLLSIAFSAAAVAQDPLAMATVPVGLSPIVQWALGLASTVFVTFVPLLAIWFKQYLAVQNTQSRAQMISNATVNAAHLAEIDMTAQHQTVADVAVPNSPIMVKALGYVGQSYPDAIKATPQADDVHLAETVLAEIHKIQLAKANHAPPSVVLSPVSALR